MFFFFQEISVCTLFRWLKKQFAKIDVVVLIASRLTRTGCAAIQLLHVDRLIISFYFGFNGSPNYFPASTKKHLVILIFSFMMFMLPF